LARKGLFSKIAIIGAGGKMGLWFLRYFASRSDVEDVRAYDIDIESLKESMSKENYSKDIYICKNIKECVRTADLVVICVPVQATSKVIRSCAASMKLGSTIAEISSVKKDSFKALRNVPKNIKPLCIHPMFGPGATRKASMKVLLVPVRNRDLEAKAASWIFEDISVRSISFRKHDRYMGLILGLNYFINIIFTEVISDENISLLKEISGTTFKVQSLLSESVLTDEPELVTALITENPYARQFIQTYIKRSSFMLSVIKSKDTVSLKKKLLELRSKVDKHQDIHLSYRKMYELIEKQC
jgi:prephenate dehydrogenase